MCDSPNVVAREEVGRKEEAMRVQGRYTKDSNFVTLFSGDVMYTIARNTGEWGSVRVGGTLANGQPFTKADYERMKGECHRVGTFVLD